MFTLAKFMILSGADNRPPMLEKLLVAKDLWERVQLLMQDSGLSVSVFKQRDDPIDAINKIMPFLSIVISSCFLTTNNQLRNSSNPREQATVHNGRVVVQPVQERQSLFATGHMARQCPKPKRIRDATWFRDIVLLVNAQGSSKVINEEELDCLADPRVTEAKAVLMANLSSYESDVLSEILVNVLSHNKNRLMQAFRLQTSHPNTDQSASSPIRIGAPRELPKLIQELLKYVRDTSPDIHKPSEKLVAVTPINKKKTVRITTTNKVPLREPVPLELIPQESVVTKVYTRRPKHSYYESVGISNETSVARSSQQNGVVERQNRTLVEVARTMLIYTKAPMGRGRKPDVAYLYVFGVLCCPNNDSEDLGKLQAKAYIVVSPVPVAVAPRAVDLADSPMYTSIDQGFEESPKTPHFHDDPLHKSLHEDSTSQGSSSNVRPIHTPFKSLGRWTKDHPIENVIRDPSRSVFTRKQQQTDAMWCYFDAF
nr:hypothetical protein [Tanacetum cinerariifolium]